mmetsp:Transcript_18143/g.54552  ORF Transcript_18143/g.54552 Transcript_18143/m.54552 type:complete len:570 (-) Transcript_18143:4095-5804(-)
MHAPPVELIDASHTSHGSSRIVGKIGGEGDVLTQARNAPRARGPRPGQGRAGAPQATCRDSFPQHCSLQGRLGALPRTGGPSGGGVLRVFQGEPHILQLDVLGRLRLHGSTRLLLGFVGKLPLLPKLGVEDRDDLRLVPPLVMKHLRPRQELPVVQVGRGQDLRVRWAQEQLVRVHDHLLLLRQLRRGEAAGVLTLVHEQRRVHEGGLVAPPLGARRALLEALHEGLAPLQALVRVLVHGVAPALHLCVEILRPHRPLCLLLLEVPEALVANLVVAGALADAQLHREAQAEATGLVVMEAAARVHRLPRGRVGVLELILPLVCGGLVLPARPHLAQLRRRGEDHDGVAGAHGVDHGVEHRDPLQPVLLVRVGLLGQLLKFPVLRVQLLPLLLQDIRLDPAGQLDLLLELVDGVVHLDRHLVPVAGGHAQLGLLLVRPRDLQLLVGRVPEVDLEVPAAARQDMGRLVRRVRPLAHDVEIAAAKLLILLLEAAGLQRGCERLVPRRVEGMLDYLCAEELVVLRVHLAAPPAPLVEAFHLLLLVLEALVLDEGPDVGVAPFHTPVHTRLRIR